MSSDQIGYAKGGFFRHKIVKASEALIHALCNVSPCKLEDYDKSPPILSFLETFVSFFKLIQKTLDGRLRSDNN